MVRPGYFCVLVAVTLAPHVSFAYFRDIRQVRDGTAYTLEKGEFMVGIFSPVQVGVTDYVTVVTHPVLYLFLTPNAVLRLKILDSDFALTMNAGYIQTFLDPKRLHFPGTVSFYPLATVAFSKRAAFSWQVGYLQDISPRAHGMMFGGGLAVLLTTRDLVNVQVQDEHYWDKRGFCHPTILLTYTHFFYRMQVRAGIAIGRFPIQIGTASANVKNFPAYPIFDLVWVL